LNTPLQIYTPAEPLSAYIEMFWYWEGYHPPHPAERILPSGTMEITISLSDTPFRVYDETPGRTPTDIVGPMVVGPHSRHFIIETAQPMSLLSVWFKAGGALALFGLGGHEMHNTHLPLNLLWGSQADKLYDDLMKAPTTRARFRILEAALTAHLHRSDHQHSAVQHALQHFCKMPTEKTVHEVVHEVGLSATRFIEVFRADVGLTPKKFCRVKRFQAALKLIASQQFTQWVDVALACGYYDQSHFINDFQHFAGILPTSYLPQNQDHNMNLPVHEIG